MPTQPEELYATTRNWDIDCEYANGVRLHFMDDATARPVVQQYHPIFRDHGTVFHGEDGWIGVDRMAMYSHDNHRLRQTVLKEGDQRLPQSPGHWENFLHCVRTREETISPFEAALRSDTISHLADIVVRTGQPLEWEPHRERIVDPTPAQQARLTRPVRDGYRFM